MFLDKMDNIPRRSFMRASIIGGFGGVSAVALANSVCNKATEVDSGVVRKFTIDEWNNDFGLYARDANYPMGAYCPIEVGVVYMEDLGIGEKIIVNGFDDADDLRYFMEIFPTCIVGLNALDERRYTNTFDEVNLTYEVTRKE